MANKDTDRRCADRQQSPAIVDKETMINKNKEKEVIRKLTDILIEFGIHYTAADVREFLQEHPNNKSREEFIQKINEWIKRRDQKRITYLLHSIFNTTTDIWTSEGFKNLTEYLRNLLLKYYSAEDTDLMFQNLFALRVRKEWKVTNPQIN